MSPVKEQLFGIIDYLSESKQALLLALAKEFLSDFTKVTLFERISLWKAQRAYARGEYYTDEDIDWGDD